MNIFSRASKLLKIVYFCFFFCLLFTETVNAYVDPSVMTYAIQAIAGIAIGIGTFVSIYWRNLKRVLKIDDRTKKEIESDAIFYVDPTTNEKHWAVDEKTADDVRKTTNDRERASSFLPAVLLVTAVCFMMFFYAPLEIYMTNRNDFWFDFSTVWVIFLKLFLVMEILGLLVYFVFWKWKKVYPFALMIGTAILLYLYIQGNLLVYNLPSLSGESIHWENYQTDKIISFSLIAVLLVLAVYCAVKLNRQWIKLISSSVSVLILLICCVTFLIIGIGSGGFADRTHIYVSKKDEFKMSSQTNMVILLLDCVDSKVFEQELEKYPEYKEAFTDFTYFPDTSGTFPFTQYAIPFILGGQWPEEGEGYSNYYSRCLSDSDLLNQLENEKWTVSLYETDLTSNKKEVFESVDNVSEGNYSVTDELKLAYDMIRFVWYKYAPFGMKDAMDYSISISVIPTLQGTSGDYEKFYDQNDDFYQDLMNSEFTLGDDNTFKFIHVEGAHLPCVYDRYVNRISKESGSYDQNVDACIQIASDYIRKLKESGTYDNTILLIMADHGFNQAFDGKGNSIVWGRQNPMFLVKGLNERHPFTIDDTPVTFDDLQTAYSDLLEGKLSNELYDSSRSVSEPRPYWFYGIKSIEEDYGERYFHEYELAGNAWNTDNLKETGRIIAKSDN